MRAWKQIINGKSVAAKSGKNISVEDPSTREVLGTVPQSGRADVDAAVAAAAAAFPAWSATTPAERALHEGGGGGRLRGSPARGRAVGGLRCERGSRSSTASR